MVKRSVFDEDPVLLSPPTTDRRAHNRLGFAYQLAFIRLANRFPAQQPFELDEELLTFVSLQLDLPTQLIETYAQRQSTLSEHQEQIRIYLDLRRFGEVEIQMLERFLLKCGRGHCVATGDEPCEPAQVA